jgi:hypothetical protein
MNRNLERRLDHIDAGIARLPRRPATHRELQQALAIVLAAIDPRKLSFEQIEAVQAAIDTIEVKP